MIVFAFLSYVKFYILQCQLNSSNIISMKRFILLMLAVLLLPLYTSFAQDGPYGSIDPGAAALLGTGIGFMETSSLLIRPMLFVAQDQALASYHDYLNNSSGRFDSDNFDDGSWANKLQVQNWTNFGAGMLFTSSLFFYPEDKVTISLAGKICLITGLATVMTGNFFDFLAMGSYAESKYYALDYKNATGNAEDIYSAYSDSYRTFKTANGLGLILKGVGGAALFTSFLLPGKKQPYFKSNLHKIMNAGALFFITAGMVTKSMAQVHVVQLPYAREDYESAATNAASLFERYSGFNKAYTALTLTSYGLWLAGGSALITALFLPAATTSELNTENLFGREGFSLSLLPEYNGNFVIGLSLSK